MNVADMVVGQLALFCFREGERLAPGSRPAKLGIAHVFRNRVESGWQNGEWMRLLADAPIHSASEIKDMDWRSYVDIWDSGFRWLHGQCSAVYDGSLKDEITISADPKKAGGTGMPKRALFYGNIQIPMRPWFVENILKSEQHPRTADAGTVTFFA